MPPSRGRPISGPPSGLVARGVRQRASQRNGRPSGRRARGQNPAYRPSAPSTFPDFPPFRPLMGGHGKIWAEPLDKPLRAAVASHAAAHSPHGYPQVICSRCVLKARRKSKFRQSISGFATRAAGRRISKLSHVIPLTPICTHDTPRIPSGRQREAFKRGNRRRQKGSRQTKVHEVRPGSLRLVKNSS